MNKKRSNMIKKNSRKLLILLLWLVLWQAAEVLVDNAVLLAGPVGVFKYLMLHIVRVDFWMTVGYSTIRIGLGFFLALFLALFLGIISFRHSLFKEFISPAVSAMNTIPVASTVVLLLIWFGTKSLTIFSVFFVVFPSLYESTLSGLSSVDSNMKEVAKVFRMGSIKKILYLYRPNLIPYLNNSCRYCIGMAVKSGVAAEVIGTPALSLGEKLYMSKISLDTAGLLGWTVVIVTLAFLFKKIFLLVLNYAGNVTIIPLSKRSEGIVIPAGNINIEGMDKNFGKKQVFENFQIRLNKGHCYCLMGESGAGKTTLLRILAGLEKPDQGKIVYEPKEQYVSMLFQEGRLFEQLNAIENIMLFCGSKEKAFNHLCQLLPEDSLYKPVQQLSGGMKRRVELVRAVTADSNLVLLDEPFNGLDEENKKRVIKYLLSNIGERILVISTHNKEDNTLINGEIITIIS